MRAPRAAPPGMGSLLDDAPRPVGSSRQHHALASEMRVLIARPTVGRSRYWSAGCPGFVARRDIRIPWIVR